LKKQRVTLKTLADRLGITVATVSRALKDYPDISPKTKAAVLSLSKELDYQPNLLAQKLRGNLSKSVGIIIPEIVHHFFSSVISGIIECAEAKGYSVFLTQSNESLEQEIGVAKKLFAAGVDGILISLSDETETAPHLKKFQEYGIPVVQFDKVDLQFKSSKVTVDDFNGAYEATEHLIEHGCKRILHIRGLDAPINSIGRFEGYKAALEKNNIPFRPEYVKQCVRVKNKEGYRLMQEALRMPNPPDGVFAITDMVAIGAADAILEAGLNIPNDIAIVGFSNVEVAKYFNPKISSVHQPGFEMGEQAMNILLNEIELSNENKDYKFTEKVLKTHLVVRASSLRKV
jgi:LacI family transcriptional regulator